MFPESGLKVGSVMRRRLDRVWTTQRQALLPKEVAFFGGTKAGLGQLFHLSCCKIASIRVRDLLPVSQYYRTSQIQIPRWEFRDNNFPQGDAPQFDGA